jgi:hypothetical protein
MVTRVVPFTKKSDFVVDFGAEVLGAVLDTDESGGDEEDVVIEFFEFGSLVFADGIFDGDGVEAELVGEEGDGLGGVLGVDVEPDGDFWVGGWVFHDPHCLEEVDFFE